MAKSCTRKRVVIKGRTGKVKASFMAHRGTNCPKPKRSTSHLREYQQMFKTEAKACAPLARKGKKFSRQAYAKCIGRGMRYAIHGRLR